MSSLYTPRPYGAALTELADRTAARMLAATARANLALLIIYLLCYTISEGNEKPMKIRKTRSLFASFLAVIGLLVATLSPVSAAQITTRKMTLSNSAGAATGVTYTFTSDAVPTTTAVKSVGVEVCTTASGGCSTPSGFSVSSATLASQPSGLGSGSGWTVNTSTAGNLRIVNAANATSSSGAVTIAWGGVVNPTATNTTFYARLTTYSDSAWSTPLDTGTMALSTSQAITVTASVNETLVFCTGTSITGQNCGTISGSSVDLGTLTTSSPGSGTSVMAASTNSGGGYVITINGTTLTSGGNTIDAITAGSGSASSPGTEQFGINLRDNATPNVGADPSGAAGYSYGTGYGTADSFKFVTGNTVTSTSAASNATAYTVSYLSNIGGATEPGSYSAVFNYVATATF